jgi:hypothetical protein
MWEFSPVTHCHSAGVREPKKIAGQPETVHGRHRHYLDRALSHSLSDRRNLSDWGRDRRRTGKEPTDTCSPPSTERQEQHDHGVCPPATNTVGITRAARRGRPGSGGGMIPAASPISQVWAKGPWRHMDSTDWPRFFFCSLRLQLETTKRKQAFQQRQRRASRYVCPRDTATEPGRPPDRAPIDHVVSWHCSATRRLSLE